MHLEDQQSQKFPQQTATAQILLVSITIKERQHTPVVHFPYALVQDQPSNQFLNQSSVETDTFLLIIFLNF